MVLCKFFQQGSCRYGSKCANEHFDVKQVIKTDVESAINGKQWPLSTYGPFKEKPSIPNFIEDQSFEEVRMLCYEAKQKNFFEQFHQQFNKEALEASNKMKALLQMTPEIVDVVINLYDTSSDSSISKNASNPFGFANTAATSAGSIFAKSTTPANNIFSSNNSTFPPQQQQQQQTSIFAQTKSANSIFASGGSNNPQQNTSIFSQQPVQSNLFTSSTQQQQPTLATTGIFSQQNQFLPQPNQNSNIFRQGAQVSQPQQGLFAQTPQTMQQQQQQQQQGLFAQAAQQIPASQGLFAQAAQQTQNMFSQVAQQQQQQANPNIFQPNQSNSGQQQQQTNLNIFQQNQPITTQHQQQQQQPPSGLFQQAALQTQNTVVKTNQLTQVSSTVYSRLEDLTAEEIEAFKSDYFLPGKIPFNPPPREFIN